MKQFIIIMLLLQAISQSSAMQYAPLEIQNMCKHRTINSETIKTGPEYHCDKLAQFFYCAHAINNNPTPAVKSYCRQVYDYHAESDKNGLPTTSELTYHIKHLAEAEKKSPEEVVNCIENAQTTMNSFISSKSIANNQ